MSNRTDRTQQVIISLSPTELEEITRIYRVKSDRIILGDNGIVGYYDAGPEVLRQMALHINVPDPDWDLLSEADQTILVSLTAGSVEWAIDGWLDAYQMDQALGEETGLRERITQAAQPPAEPAQPVSAIVSAPQTVLKEFARTHNLTLQYIEESENRAHYHYHDGPQALAQVQDALGADRALAPTWDDLAPEDQKKIVERILVDNPSWIDDQTIGNAATDISPGGEFAARITGRYSPEATGG